MSALEILTVSLRVMNSVKERFCLDANSIVHDRHIVGHGLTKTMGMTSGIKERAIFMGYNASKLSRHRPDRSIVTKSPN
jgi:hypothetical protein